MGQTELSIMEPKPYQVIQRHGYHPATAYGNNPNRSCMGKADVRIVGSLTGADKGKMEAKTVLLEKAYGEETDWTTLEVNWENGLFKADMDIPAGGWYRLEVRIMAVGKEIGQASVEPIGVGEVFLIAGQSYAESCNEETTFIEDAQGRITAYDLHRKEWRIAHDPQPPVVELDRKLKFEGTIWPSAMNLLLPLVQVPIGMANVAVGGTAIRQWLPGEELFGLFSQCGSDIRDFRCILWQQGESDVIEATSKELYIDRLLQMKAGLEQQWSMQRTWLPAKSTIHPTVYMEPEREAWIRAAIDEVWQMPGFAPGPDTDILDGVGLHRADHEHGRHFSGLGQKRAGFMWCIALWTFLQAGSLDVNSH